MHGGGEEDAQGRQNGSGRVDGMHGGGEEDAQGRQNGSGRVDGTEARDGVSIAGDNLF
jgi:hypothetical protein